jgi:CDI immunity proteins
MMGSSQSFAQSIEDLEGDCWGDPPADATGMVQRCHVLRRKSLKDLAPEEIGLAVRQRVGLPFILDLALAKLRNNPLFEGEFYPGDVMAALVKLPNSEWAARPHLKAELDQLQKQALIAIESDEADDLMILAGELKSKP